MKRKSLILRGAFDVELMKKILPFDVLSEIDIQDGGGSTSAISKARTLMAFFDKDVVVVLNTDTTNSERIQEQKGDIEYLLNNASHKQDAWRLILAEPELEAIFFETKQLAKDIFHKDFTDTELELGRVVPRRVIEKKLGMPILEARKVLLDSITEPVANELLKTNLMRQVQHELRA